MTWERHTDAILLLLSTPLIPARFLLLLDHLVRVEVGLWCIGGHGNAFAFLCHISVVQALVVLEKGQDKKCSKDSLISPQKEHAGNGIIPILLRKEFVTRHLLSNLL